MKLLVLTLCIVSLSDGAPQFSLRSGRPLSLGKPALPDFFFANFLPLVDASVQSNIVAEAPPKVAKVEEQVTKVKEVKQVVLSTTVEHSKPLPRIEVVKEKPAEETIAAIAPVVAEDETKIEKSEPVKATAEEAPIVSEDVLIKEDKKIVEDKVPTEEERSEISKDKENEQVKTTPEEIIIATKDVPKDAPIVTKDVPEEAPIATKDIPQEAPIATKDVQEEEPIVTKDVPEEAPIVTKDVPEEEPIATKDVPEESPIAKMDVAEEAPIAAKDIPEESQIATVDEIIKEDKKISEQKLPTEDESLNISKDKELTDIKDEVTEVKTTAVEIEQIKLETESVKEGRAIIIENTVNKVKVVEPLVKPDDTVIMEETAKEPEKEIIEPSLDDIPTTTPVNIEEIEVKEIEVLDEIIPDLTTPANIEEEPETTTLPNKIVRKVVSVKKIKKEDIEAVETGPRGKSLLDSLFQASNIEELTVEISESKTEDSESKTEDSQIKTISVIREEPTTTIASNLDDTEVTPESVVSRIEEIQEITTLDPILSDVDDPVKTKEATIISDSDGIEKILDIKDSTIIEQEEAPIIVSLVADIELNEKEIEVQEPKILENEAIETVLPLKTKEKKAIDIESIKVINNNNNVVKQAKSEEPIEEIVSLDEPKEIAEEIVKVELVADVKTEEVIQKPATVEVSSDVKLQEVNEEPTAIEVTNDDKVQEVVQELPNVEDSSDVKIQVVQEPVTVEVSSDAEIEVAKAPVKVEVSSDDKTQDVIQEPATVEVSSDVKTQEMIQEPVAVEVSSDVKLQEVIQEPVVVEVSSDVKIQGEIQKPETVEISSKTETKEIQEPVKVEVSEPVKIIEEIQEPIAAVSISEKTQEEIPKVATVEVSNVVKTEEVLPIQEVKEAIEVVSTPIVSEVSIIKEEISTTDIVKPNVIPVKTSISTNIGTSGTGKSLFSEPHQQRLSFNRLSIGHQPIVRSFGFGSLGVHSGIAPVPVLYNGAFVDPRTLVAPRFRQFIFSNDASDVVAAKVALFRLHGALRPNGPTGTKQ